MCNEKGWYVNYGSLCYGTHTTADSTLQRAPIDIWFHISPNDSNWIWVFMFYLVLLWLLGFICVTWVPMGAYFLMVKREKT